MVRLEILRDLTLVDVEGALLTQVRVELAVPRVNDRFWVTRFFTLELCQLFKLGLTLVKYFCM